MIRTNYPFRSANYRKRDFKKQVMARYREFAEKERVDFGSAKISAAYFWLSTG